MLNVENNKGICKTFNKKYFLNLLQVQVESLQKIQTLLNNFLKSIVETTTINDINNNITILYNNIVSLLTKKYINIQVFNVSLTRETVKGFYILCKTLEKSTFIDLSYFVNSVRVQINKDIPIHMIKVIFNDENNFPEQLILIGKKRSLDTDINVILNDYKSSLSKALTILTTIENKYLSLLNGFKEL